ncbi:MAG: hypothetical protein FWE30_00770 [Bacteroidales bacterium]|nr:hypothetical protein [Bacteroidales bacterium]MCL2737961.1 hypothetical protein [Bacteroidales bacterium]
MPTRIFRFTLLLAGLFLLTSCFSYRDIEVKDFNIDNVSMQGTRIVADFSATVHNPNRGFVIQSAEGVFNRGQQPFATAQLLQALTVAGRSEQRCSGQLELTLQDLFAALQMGIDYRTWDISSFLFTGDMRIKSACIKKTFSYKDTPLTQIINSL